MTTPALANISIDDYRRKCLAALTLVVLFLTACGSQNDSGDLTSAVQQEGMTSCMEAPNPGDSAENPVPKWNTPIGFALVSYYDASLSPVTIQKVSLIDSHNLVVLASVVVKRPQAGTELASVASWRTIGATAKPALWAQRQRVPGAVIPPTNGSTNAPGPKGRDLYQIVTEVRLSTPGGGWAIGQEVDYSEGGHSYVKRVYEGYGITPPDPAGSICDTYDHEIVKAFPSPPPPQ